MKKILATMMFSLLLGFTTEVMAKNIQFAQISDMHLSQIAEDEIAQGELTKGDYLLKAIKEINKNKNVKFVIFSGDSINNPDKKTMSKFLTIADKLNKPYYLVIGDKEVLRRKNFDKKNFMRAYKRHNLSMLFKKENYVIKPNKDIVFLFVDGTNETFPSNSGYFKEDTLNWLDKKLKKYKNKKIVIVQHYPIIPPSSKIGYATIEPEKYFHVINSHENVIAILSGHFHKDNTFYKKGIYHMSAPAFAAEKYEYKIINIKYEPKFLFSKPSEFEITQKIIPVNNEIMNFDTENTENTETLVDVELPEEY